MSTTHLTAKEMKERVRLLTGRRLRPTRGHRSLSAITRADFGVFEINASNEFGASPTSVPSLSWCKKRHSGCRPLASCQP